MCLDYGCLDGKALTPLSLARCPTNTAAVAAFPPRARSPARHLAAGARVGGDLIAAATFGAHFLRGSVLKRRREGGRPSGAELEWATPSGSARERAADHPPSNHELSYAAQKRCRGRKEGREGAMQLRGIITPAERVSGLSSLPCLPGSPGLHHHHRGEQEVRIRRRDGDRMEKLIK